MIKQICKSCKMFNVKERECTDTITWINPNETVTHCGWYKKGTYKVKKKVKSK